MKTYKQIKCLHLASFSGNSGDIANHLGFYKKIKENFSSNMIFNQIEIRNFYKNSAKMKFDDDFVNLVNSHDLFILGGGGFFDLNWDYSHTGCTINLSEEIISKIKIPVLVNGMGYHEFGIPNERNILKFHNFLDNILSNKRWFLTLRNDGSISRVINRYKNLKYKIKSIPDNGFFFTSNKNKLIDENRQFLGVNVTNDLFNKIFNKDIDVEIFNNLFVNFINNILDQNPEKKIFFFPHTPQDINIIDMLIGKMKEEYKRERVLVAPYFGSDVMMTNNFFNFYRYCSVVIGMRFHTNVCCISMNIPTIGLAGHEQISSLYDEINMPDRCVKINKISFIDELNLKVEQSFKETQSIKKKYNITNDILNKKSNECYKEIKEWFFNL